MLKTSLSALAEKWVQDALAAPPWEAVHDWTMRNMVRAYPREVLLAYWRVFFAQRQSSIMPPHSFAPSDHEYEQIELVMRQAQESAEHVEAQFREIAVQHGVDPEALRADIAFIWKNWTSLKLG